jgi:hypothetical protein
MSDLHSINEAINKKAGRKLLPSIAVGLSLLTLVWFSLSFQREIFAIVVAVAVILGVRELVRAFSYWSVICGVGRGSCWSCRCYSDRISTVTYSRTVARSRRICGKSNRHNLWIALPTFLSWLFNSVGTTKYRFPTCHDLCGFGWMQ